MEFGLSPCVTKVTYLLYKHVNPVRCTTYQLVEWQTVGVTIVISVCENPAILSSPGPVQGFDVRVVLTFQRGLTCCFILEQFHFILEAQTDVVGKWD